MRAYSALFERLVASRSSDRQGGRLVPLVMVITTDLHSLVVALAGLASQMFGRVLLLDFLR